ncbi:hypothetical protein [Saccharopolyspora phatthalungensis]|uniref:Uncharacterized protein n=1 Tax=Saccharopolyspora phatthalungensis TaxID=664693 RepID=A0A840QFR0_9PSEU|nr:hypothetical protein [Saccharopolyspora phatthalungensis]MBB5159276.1 hypothetical protein [Saccharopolyspora phatthalungensis]
MPLEFCDPDDYAGIGVDDSLLFDDLPGALSAGNELDVRNTTRNRSIRVRHRLSPRQVDAVLAGGVIPLLASRA